MADDPREKHGELAHRVIDALPPKVWDVNVWPPKEARTTYVSGRLDKADAFYLVASILAAVDGIEAES